MLKRIIAGAAGGFVLVMAGVGPAIANNDDSTGTHTVGGITTDVPVETLDDLYAFVESDAPKRIDQDASGNITAVYEGSSVRPLSITQSQVCSSGQMCLWAASIPYSDFGFSGTGTLTGTWTHRGGWSTGDHQGKVRLQGGDYTAVWFGKNSDSNFSYENTIVTGVKRQ
jgi:hypothetical protein